MEFHINIWYLIKAKPRMEDISEINMNNQGFKYFLTRFLSGNQAGKVIFPGYIFIKPKTNKTFESIQSTKGISDFVRLGIAFATASDETIYKLKKLIDVINNRMD